MAPKKKAPKNPPLGCKRAASHCCGTGPCGSACIPPSGQYLLRAASRSSSRAAALFARRPPTPKQMDENRLVEEARMTAEEAAADEEWMVGLSAFLLTRTSRSLRTVRSIYAYQPPACEGAGQLTPRRHARTSPGRTVPCAVPYCTDAYRGNPGERGSR